jgi:hypothetical protein
MTRSGRNSSIHLPCLLHFALGFLLLAPSTGRAQEPSGEEDAPAAPHLPADSMELGATYVDWMLDYRADSLWAHFGDGMRENFGSVGDFKDRMANLFREIGDQRSVISQRYWMRNGRPQFWHTAEFSGVPEPVVIRFVVEPDGSISGLGLNPQSRNPAVDDPNQHGAEVDPAGG